ncbi:hypothetical protein B0H21DRAFT_582246 [Amylocystis lapponica]|nr:hypothetical protein B0H21DRAFT_582246 [Amylocystis lapponica]
MLIKLLRVTESLGTDSDKYKLPFSAGPAILTGDEFMSTLSVPTSWFMTRSTSPDEFVQLLQVGYGTSSLGPHCVVKAAERIHSGSANIYLAIVNDDNRVVCKVSFESRKVDRVRHEAGIYETFKALQGDLIPRCYGYYEQKDERRGLRGCLVLEYCGSPIEVDDFSLIPRTYKWSRLWRRFMRWDTNTDFRRDNVVVDDGKLRLLDFEYTDRHPGTKGRCGNFIVNQPIVCGDDEAPVSYCQELHDVALKISAWRPGALYNFERDCSGPIPLFQLNFVARVKS